VSAVSDVSGCVQIDTTSVSIQDLVRRSDEFTVASTTAAAAAVAVVITEVSVAPYITCAITCLALEIAEESRV
jgi:hypothetical protein